MAKKVHKKEEVVSLEHDARLSKIYNDWFNANNTTYIIHAGETGSGKTFNALIRLKQRGSGVYLAPLRLLAWEVYEKLNSDGFPCNLLTGEEELQNEGAQIMSSTIEMLDYSKVHDTVIIDEAFMVADRDRGKSWLKAMLRVKAREVNIILNNESLALIKQILDSAHRKYTVKEYTALQKFSFTDDPFNLDGVIPDKGVFVTFSRIEVLINKMKLEALGKNVSVLYGNLPPEVKKRQIELFINGTNEVMVSTDVIGMGINIPCDYIVFLETEKFDGVTTRKLRSGEVRQISGRTGRYGLSNNNSFVSALRRKDLAYITEKYHTPTEVSKAYFGFDFEIFSALPEGASIYDRIKYFSTANIIPDKVTDIIKKEATEKYFEIAFLLESYKFDLETQWRFLTAPMKRNNTDYFTEAIEHYHHQKTLKRPSCDILTGDARYLEDKISEFELYVNMARYLPYIEHEKYYSINTKEQLITELQRVLLDKKLSSKKQCRTCTTMLKITSPYNYCNDCHQSYYNKRNSSWA